MVTPKNLHLQPLADCGRYRAKIRKSSALKMEALLHFNRLWQRGDSAFLPDQASGQQVQGLPGQAKVARLRSVIPPFFLESR